MNDSDHPGNAPDPARPTPDGFDAAAAPRGPTQDPTRWTVSEPVPGWGIEPVSEPVTRHDGGGEALISPVPLPAEVAVLAGGPCWVLDPQRPEPAPPVDPATDDPGPALTTSTSPDVFDLARRRRGGS